MTAEKKERGDFAPRVPHTVRGGIRAQLRRSQGPRKPWAKKWLAYMEALSMGARLGRGRSYAMSGQVFDLAVSPGLVEANVQGAGPRPYLCQIRCDAARGAARRRLVAALRGRPMLLAQLLVRNLPASAETLFAAAGRPLLPAPGSPLVPSCSCPDPSHNCKHVAAVLFILSEAIEQDPMLLLAMRGVMADDLFGRADAPAGAPERAKPCGKARGGRARDDSFWGDSPEGEFDYGPAPERDGEGAPLARRLGALPFWRGEQRFLETLSQCGSRAAEAGWRTWAGEPPARLFDVSAGTPVREPFARYP